MNQNTFHWIEQQAKKFESTCYFAYSKIRTAQTMKDVKCYANVSVPAEVSAIRNQVPGYRHLQLNALNKMTELLEKQLYLIKKTPSEEEAKQLLAKLMSTDWQYLRGDYAMVYRRAEAEARRIIHQKLQLQESH